jgi:hypothetical protein
MSAMKDELVTSTEAARLLHVSTRRMQQMIRAGFLPPHPSSTAKQRYFRMRDVLALQEIRSKGHQLDANYVLARESAMETQALRREVERIRFVLGIDIPTIATDRDTVVSLVLKGEDELRAPPTMDHETLLEWGKVFHGLSEAHFESITFHTGAKEPWRVFLTLAKKLVAEENRAITRTDLELASIYRLLAATQRRLRETAYFYIRAEYGKAYAARLLPEVKGCPHEDVIALAFNNLNWSLAPTPDKCRPSRSEPVVPGSSRDLDG